MRARRAAWLMLLLAFACRGETSSQSAPSATVSAPIPSAAPAQPPDEIDDEPLESVDDTPDQEDPEEACAPANAKLKPMQLLRFTWTDRISHKDPDDKLRVARQGQRVYAHIRIRNRSGRERCLRLTFRVAGKKRTVVPLRIGKSWNWRTWAYNTLRTDDIGPLTVEVKDDQGKLILKKTLGVIPR